jgi:hypothetical protein
MSAEKSPADPDRFKKLPEHIALEDTIEEKPTVDPPDPNLGRDPEKDFFLRNAGA